MSNYKDNLRDAVVEGAWQLLQHFVCRDYKTSQRGNGAGGVHSRHNAHHLYPAHNYHSIKSEISPKKCDDRVKINMVSPAQATVEQAESKAEELKGSVHSTYHQSHLKRPRGQRSVTPKKKRIYSDTVFQDGSKLY